MRIISNFWRQTLTVATSAIMFSGVFAIANTAVQAGGEMEKAQNMRSSMMDDSRMERRMRQNRESSERSNMMDDSMDNTIKTYLFGSLGQAKYNLKQSDIDPATGAVPGLTPDDDDIVFRGGLGYMLSNTLSAEIAIADLGSPVNVENPVGVTTAQVDLEYDQAFEVSFVNQFDIGRGNMRPIARLGVVKLDGDKNDDTDIVVGVGLQSGRFRVELQRYNINPEPVDAVFFSYMLPFSLQ